MRAASIWIFSSLFASYWVQFSHTTSAYIMTGRMKEKYIDCNDFLSRINFNCLIMLMRHQTLDFISVKCACKVSSQVKVKPKCLCISTSFICCEFMLRDGCKDLLCFQENRRHSDLEGLKLTSRFFAFKCIVSKSELHGP